MLVLLDLLVGNTSYSSDVEINKIFLIGAQGIPGIIGRKGRQGIRGLTVTFANIFSILFDDTNQIAFAFFFKGPIGPQGLQGSVGQKGDRGIVSVLLLRNIIF